MTPKTVSTPCSPRLVTVMVGSESSELRSPPLRARCTRSRKPRMRSPRLLPAVSWSAGATRPPPRSEIATPTWTASLRTGSPPRQHRVQLRHVPQGQRHRLDEQHAVEEPVRDRPLEVLLGEPGHRPVHVDRRGEVVVGDLALGARHGGPDGLPRPRLPVERRAGLLGGRRGPRGRGLLDVLAPDRAAGPRAADARGIDAELGGALPRERRDPDPVGRGRGRRDRAARRRDDRGAAAAARQRAGAAAGVVSRMIASTVAGRAPWRPAARGSSRARRA